MLISRRQLLHSCLPNYTPLHSPHKPPPCYTHTLRPIGPTENPKSTSLPACWGLPETMCFPPVGYLLG